MRIVLDAVIYWHCLPNVVRDGDGDQIGAANAAVGRIESVEINPARFLKEERCFDPCMVALHRSWQSMHVHVTSRML